MTEKELARFNRGNELKKNIENLERDIEKIESDFQPPYPRTLCCIKLTGLINDRPVEMRLDSDELDECVELVLQKRVERLKWLKDEFKRL